MIVKRLERGEDWVELHFDDRRVRLFEVSPAGKVEHDCGGSWPEAEGEFLDRVSTLREEGFVVVNNPVPALRVLTNIERYGDWVVRNQELAYEPMDSKAAATQVKEEFGFKSKKEMNAEAQAWADYLYGEPELWTAVEVRHLEACR